MDPLPISMPTAAQANNLSTNTVGVAELRQQRERVLFNRYLSEWNRDTQNISNAGIVLSHPAYHRILAMSTSALPYIFEDLVSGDGAKWLPALEAITLGMVNPVKPEHEDDAELMCEDWLKWWSGDESIA